MKLKLKSASQHDAITVPHSLRSHGDAITNFKFTFLSPTDVRSSPLVLPLVASNSPTPSLVASNGRCSHFAVHRHRPCARRTNPDDTHEQQPHLHGHHAAGYRALLRVVPPRVRLPRSMVRLEGHVFCVQAHGPERLHSGRGPR